MSIRPTEINNPMFVSGVSDLAESEIKKGELKKKYLFLLLFLLIDYIMTIFNIFQESNIFRGEEENDYTFLSINAICFTVFEVFILISLSLFRIFLSKVIKYLFLIIIFLYFFFLLIRKIIFFVNHFEEVSIIDLLFLFLLLISIVPKLFFFGSIDGFIIKLLEKNECQREEDHEDFRQDLENKMERGDNTNWSKTSLPNEPRTTN